MNYKQRRIISCILCTLLICCSFGLASFADTNIAEPATTTVVAHDLFVSVMGIVDLAANADSLENTEHYTMCIPLTDKEFNKLAKFTRDELKNYLTNLATTLCKKKIDFNFDWSPVPSTHLKDSAAVGFSGMYLGLTNITNVSGWQQHMLIGSSTWGTKQSMTTSIAGNGIETHGIDPKITDVRLQGGITFTASNPKTAVTAGAYFIAFGQYAHTTIGIMPPTASVGTGGFTWSIPIGTFIIKSTQESKSNILTY